jgi:hypothetical protein
MRDGGMAGSRRTRGRRLADVGERARQRAIQVIG